jgi:hypothetical protein
MRLLTSVQMLVVLCLIAPRVVVADSLPLSEHPLTVRLLIDERPRPLGERRASPSRLKNNPASSLFPKFSRSRSTMDKFSREDFERFEKRARELGLTPSQLLEKHLTGNPPEEAKGDFTPIPYPKPPPGNIKRRRMIE